MIPHASFERSVWIGWTTPDPQMVAFLGFNLNVNCAPSPQFGTVWVGVPHPLPEALLLSFNEIPR